MAEDGLKSFVREIADAIRIQTKSEDKINPQNFADIIASLNSDGGADYFIESVDNGDGTQTLKITHKDYVEDLPGDDSGEGGGQIPEEPTPEEPTPEEPTLTFSRTFSENTPAQISAVSEQISKNNMTSSQVEETYGWKIGDTKDITLSTGELIQMQIIGFNHDDKSDGSGKAGITLQMKDCLATIYYYHSKGNLRGGYINTDMRTSHLPSIKETLPSDWQGVIKLVDKKSANGDKTTSGQAITNSEYLFLLSEIEVYGTVFWAQDGENEGSLYEYYAVNNTNNGRIKKYDTNGDNVPDTYFRWWLRSCWIENQGNFSMVANTGECGRNDASQSRGISFAFCV